MSREPDCIFCKIVAGEAPAAKVYEDAHALAFHDINPQAPVHVLVIPKGRYVSMVDFAASASPAEQAGFLRAVGKTAAALGLDAGGYRTLANHGANAHQEVPHFHVHIFGGRRLGPMLSGGRPPPSSAATE
jgi:diadenosine tetraphosphate (Ap4A) HIT family hydrolase